MIVNIEASNTLVDFDEPHCTDKIYDATLVSILAYMRESIQQNIYNFCSKEHITKFNAANHFPNPLAK